MPPPVEFEDRGSWYSCTVNEMIVVMNGSQSASCRHRIAEAEAINLIREEEAANSQRARKPEEAQVQKPDTTAKKIKVRG